MTTWTTPADVRERLTKSWNRGTYLSAMARGEDFAPLDLKITGPKAAELNSRRTEVVAWTGLWHEQDQAAETHVVYRTAGGRGLVGQHRLPDRLQIRSLADMERFLSTTAQTRRYREILTLTADLPLLRDWVSGKPIRALEHHAHFAALLSALDWIAANAGTGRRLREIDTEGVDTKFIERNQRILLELGRLVVEPDLIDDSQASLAGRFGFAVPDQRVRLRRLDQEMEWPLGRFDDVEVRTEDLAAVPLAGRVYIIENLATYLAFPSVPGAVAVFGGGYAATVLGSVGWLADAETYYWGDLDTHGFAILDRLRVRLPAACSILMDSATLLSYRPMWGREPSQIDRELSNLTETERQCYRELVDGEHGPGVRLEQERIPLSAVTSALAASGHPSPCPG